MATTYQTLDRYFIHISVQHKTLCGLLVNEDYKIRYMSIGNPTRAIISIEVGVETVDSSVSNSHVGGVSSYSQTKQRGQTKMTVGRAGGNTSMDPVVVSEVSRNRTNEPSDTPEERTALTGGFRT